MGEEWRSIPGYADYEVSNLGRVRSYKPWRSQPVPHLKVQNANRKGYLSVRLVQHTGEPNRTVEVHTLVALAFIGPRPEGPGGRQIRHLNSQSSDNRPENLAYGSYGENQRDSVLVGTHNRARRTHCNHGHAFTPENTLTRKQSAGIYRACRECARLRQFLRRRRQAAERQAVEQVSAA